ncbi:MAG: putative alpha-galactosidase [Benniella sp.]|nr:MAG: putative alpha-galactosidase [Benniella sp.]
MRSLFSHTLLFWQTFSQTYFGQRNPSPPSHLDTRIRDPSTQGPPLLAPTPPMGYNNWARYECHLNQKLFTDTADWMVTHGLLTAGYDTITIDDCWMAMDRDPITKQLVVNSTLFPQGMNWLSQYLHQRGFKFGIYQDAGYKTCGGYPGSQGYYDIDIAQFAGWQVDYIKLDGCNINKNESLPPSNTLEPTFRQLYARFGAAIRSQPRPIVFSESAPAYFAGEDAHTGDKVGKDWYKVLTWIGRYGQLWRHSNDVAVYRKDGKSRWGSVMTNYGFNIRLARFQKPGNWNDPDFIITGDDEGLTMDEQKSQFALWSIMASPLILSTDVRQLNQEQIAYLTNPEIIAVNQDPLGIQGRIAWRTNQSDVLVKPLQDTSARAVAVLNKQNSAVNIAVPFARLGFAQATGCEYLVSELLSQTEHIIRVTSPRQQSIDTLLRPHATALYKITTQTNDASCRATIPTGSIFLTSSLLCLDASNSGTAPGTPAFAFPCTTHENQLWQTWTVPPTFTLHTTTSNLRAPFWIKTLDNLCLDTEIKNITLSPGSKVVLNPCNVTRKTQQWTYEPLEGTLFHTSTKLCVDALGAGTEIGKTGVRLRLWECGFQADSQVWSMPA